MTQREAKQRKAEWNKALAEGCVVRCNGGGRRLDCDRYSAKPKTISDMTPEELRFHLYTKHGKAEV